MKHKNIGSNFDDFLKEEGILADVEAVAVKRVIAYQIKHLLDEQKITKLALSQKMGTSRSSLDRLLDPSDTSLSLKTLSRVAFSLGKKLSIQLI